MDEIIDEMCAAIAEGMVGDAIDTMFSMCVNEGQESLIDDCSGDYEDQIEDISEGEFSEVESGHPEATGIINEVGNMICGAAANICAQLREMADALEAFF